LDQALKSKYLAVGAGVGIAILLTLIVLVFKLARRGSTSSSVEMAPQLASGQGGDDAFNQKIESQLAEQAALRQKQETEALSALKTQAVTKKAEVLTKHIADQAKKDSTAMAHVLRSWMSDNKN